MHDSGARFLVDIARRAKPFAKSDWETLLRIDHVLLSEALKECCLASRIDKEPRTWEQPSDHAPVIADLRL